MDLIELTSEEQTLLAAFRALDEFGRKELLRHASQQEEMATSTTATCFPLASGQCRLVRGQDRPETAAEPIFTE